MNQTINKLRNDRDRVLRAIAKAPDVSNALILCTIVQALTRFTCHIITTAEKENRRVTPHEQCHIDAWAAALKSIAKDLDMFTTGK